jgi:hypothetical protein
MWLTNYIAFLATTTTIIIIIAHRICFVPRHSWLARRRGQRAQYNRRLSLDAWRSFRVRAEFLDQAKIQFLNKRRARECNRMWSGAIHDRHAGRKGASEACGRWEAPLGTIDTRFATECLQWKPRQWQLAGSGSGDFSFIMRIWWGYYLPCIPTGTEGPI